MSLPPMEKESRKRVHQLAECVCVSFLFAFILASY
jgi:hypothetical protein